MTCISDASMPGWEQDPEPVTRVITLAEQGDCGSLTYRPSQGSEQRAAALIAPPHLQPPLCRGASAPLSHRWKRAASSRAPCACRVPLTGLASDPKVDYKQLLIDAKTSRLYSWGDNVLKLAGTSAPCFLYPQEVYVHAIAQDKNPTMVHGAALSAEPHQNLRHLPARHALPGNAGPALLPVTHDVRRGGMQPSSSKWPCLY